MYASAAHPFAIHSVLFCLDFAHLREASDYLPGFLNACIKHPHIVIVNGPCRLRCLYLIISPNWKLGQSVRSVLWHVLGFMACFTISRHSHSYVVSYKKLSHLAPGFQFTLTHVVCGFQVKYRCGFAPARCPLWHLPVAHAFRAADHDCRAGALLRGNERLPARLSELLTLSLLTA